MPSKKKYKEKKKKGLLGWIILGVLVVIFVFSFRTSIAKTLLHPYQATTLPVDIQKSIQSEAIKELKEGVSPKDADVVAEVDNEDIKTLKSTIFPDNPFYIFKRLGRRIQELLIFDSAAKANLILKHNNNEMLETLAFLQKGGSADIAARQIAEVQNRFNEILSLSEKNNEIKALGFNYAQKYFRYELILKELEVKLNDVDFAKIESARLKNLGVFGKILTSYHPDPEVLSRELARGLSPETGIDYKELKTTEILQEIEDATKNETQKLTLRLAQYILIERFEKKLIAMPITDRREFLDDFIDKISGNPIKDFETFTRIRKVFKSHELIIYAEVYKARALENFEKRILALDTDQLQNEFIQTQIKDPEDLRILEALELRAKSQRNSKLLGIINKLKSKSRQEIASEIDDIKDTNFYKVATTYPDVLDVKVAQDFVPGIEKQVENKFVSNTDLDIQSAINAEIVLDSIEVPNSISEVDDLITELEQNPVIQDVTQNLQIPIDEIIEAIDIQVTELTANEIEQRTEQLTEEIFSAPAGIETVIEGELPAPIQQEIEQIQQTSNEVPQVNEGLVQTVVNTVVQETTPVPQPPVINSVVESPPPTVSVPSL